MGDFGACDAAEALATAIDAEQVAQRAREFLYKPDGGASLRVSPFRVALTRLTRPPDVSYKLGLHLEQDPLLYTEGTEFLMPGPLGNLYQVPMNLKVRMMLQLQARKAFDIYRSVNFPRPPADFMVRACALCRRSPLSLLALVRGRRMCGTRRSAARPRWWLTRRMTRTTSLLASRSLPRLVVWHPCR